FWATGTWWIPMLFILALWRHGYKKFPLTYDPLYWGAVFPLGMYTACTFEMARAMNLGFLLPIPRVFIYVALAAWSAAFYGMVHRLVTPSKQAAPGGADFLVTTASGRATASRADVTASRGQAGGA
ncbi:MAG: hypothetical protein HYV20_02010, partial [Gemmatimonadetes bacterium]|nr:hypothetical protein [Gemmatimonadota bacterium]